MARIDKAAVLRQATEGARRVHVVSKDPAVHKAALQAGQDVAQAVSSCSALGHEIQTSWTRSA